MILKYTTTLLLMSLFLSCSPTEDQTEEEHNPQSQTESFDFRTFIGQDYLIDNQHSYIGFKIKYFGYSPVRGRFNDFDGTLFYDPTDINSLSVSVSIDVNSINTGNESRDEDLQKEGSWFDAAQYPYILFSSEKIIPKPNGAFDIEGTLSMKGLSKTVQIACQKPTELTKDWAGNDQVDFSGTLTLNRQDFGVFGGDFWSSVMENGLTQLSDEVEIELDIHCRKADYQARYENADSLDHRKIVLDIIKEEGIDAGIKQIDELFQNEQLSAGKLSTIGYTLNQWQMFDEADAIFGKRSQYYSDKHSSWNQLGITHLFRNNPKEARASFERMRSLDSVNSRALEYLRLMEKLP